jgi:Cu+-exporting ATPase
MFQCVHCDEPALVPIFRSEDQEHKLPFCCTGCLTVYEVLKEKSLTKYYDIKTSSAIFRRRAPVEKYQSTFSYLDEEIYHTDHCGLKDDGFSKIDFYLV